MSNQLEQIKKLYAKPKTYTIPKEPKEGVEQVILDLTPLSLDDLSELDIREDMPLPELTKNITVMVSKSIGVTKEEAGKISFEFMMDLLNAVIDVNNFNEEDIKKTGIQDFIKKKQDQMKLEEKKDEQTTSTA